MFVIIDTHHYIVFHNYHSTLSYKCEFHLRQTPSHRCCIDMRDNESIVPGEYSHSNPMAQAFKAVGVCGGVNCQGCYSCTKKCSLKMKCKQTLVDSVHSNDYFGLNQPESVCTVLLINLFAWYHTAVHAVLMDAKL